MKKISVLLVAVLLLGGAFVFGEESILIDFTTLQADIIPNAQEVNTVNRRTAMDYSVAAGMSFTTEQKALLKTSLALPQWEVILNSSARTPDAVTLSNVRPAPVKDTATVPFAGKEVMGVRIVFPASSVNANARIQPPFEISAYEPLRAADENGTRQEQTPEEKASGLTLFEYDVTDEAVVKTGYGIVKNVGAVKAVSVTTMGDNFPHKLYVLLQDTDGVERRYYMGTLEFDGWKELIWQNSNYIANIRARELRLSPIYPKGLPFVKFTGFQIARDALHDGNDFVGYFKDVKIIYDKAVLSTDRDIAEEDLWKIVATKEDARRTAAMMGFGTKQVNRYIEQEMQATEANFTSSLVPPANQQ